jgi:ABC-type transport system involved in multi-copper enzyme maturation permease subunit
MIRVIKAEIAKHLRRPAFRVGAALVALLVLLNYGISLLEIIFPSIAPASGVNVAVLYPDQFVNDVTGAAPLSGAIAMIVGGLMAGSDYTWGSFKTALTQRAGRLTTALGRIVAYVLFTAVLTLIIFAVGAASSMVVALYEGHAIAWPASTDILKGFGAIWLVISVSGTLGVALGTLFRQAAAAVGVGLVYGLALQVLVVRFIAGINNGAYKWVADLFEGQNSTALLHSFTSPAFGPVPPPDITASRAALVLVVYVAAYVIATSALVWRRDVA